VTNGGEVSEDNGLGAAQLPNDLGKRGVGSIPARVEVRCEKRGEHVMQIWLGPSNQVAKCHLGEDFFCRLAQGLRRDAAFCQEGDGPLPHTLKRFLRVGESPGQWSNDPLRK
jgi:hypothetical protein